MKSRLAAIAVAALTQFAVAQEGAAVQADDAASAVAAWRENPTEVFDAAEVDLEAFRWIARPIIAFADTPSDPAFQEQLELLKERPAGIEARDVIIVGDADPSAQTELRQRLRPRGFMLVLMGKDLQVELRKPFPWDAREIFRSIDKMPLRQQELREGRRTLTD